MQIELTWYFSPSLLCAQAAGAKANFEKELRRTFVGKNLPLKTCTENDSTHNVPGAPVENCGGGSWNIYSLFHIEKIKLRNTILEITGTRGVETAIAIKPGTALTWPDSDGRVLTFHLSAPLSDMPTANKILAAVFDSDTERKEKLVRYKTLLSMPTPDWQQPDHAPSQPSDRKAPELLGMLGPDRPAYRTDLQRGIKPPVATLAPDPAYSVAAREAKVQGVVVLSMVVNKRGQPELIEVVRRLGYGLDEKAVAAVSGWKFTPASLDGNPVAVLIAVEVAFHLY